MNFLIALIVALATQPNINYAYGEFYHEVPVCTIDTCEPHTWYQFRSDDDSVWWGLEEEEIGHIPKLNNDKYLLVFDDNGTTEQRSTCDCLVEWDCECHLYDDEFIAIIKLS